MTRAPEEKSPPKSGLLKTESRAFALNALRGFSISRSEDRIDGKIGTARSGRLGALATARLSGKAQGRSQARVTRAAAGRVADPRQKVIVKLHYHAHRGASGGKLLAHSRYLERDGTGASDGPGLFYDKDGDAQDVQARLRTWEQDDKRHARIILAPESGARFVDLKDATRSIMSRMERDLGLPLEWVAVDHFNTDNPHVHVVLRGRRRDGPDLIIPREYAAHGLRRAARDVATEMLGLRSREDDRLALDREVRSLRLTRLDDLLQTHADPSEPVRLQSLGQGLDPALASALRGRLRELAKMGLATENVRDVLELTPGWRETLQRAGDQTDIKRMLNRPLEPDLPKTRLYSPTMGALAGEVLQWGVRGKDGGKAFVILKPDTGAPTLVNTSAKAILMMEKGDIAVVQPGARLSSRAKLSFIRVSDLQRQATEPAFTPLDRDLLRAAAGEPALLPAFSQVAQKLREREIWLEKEGFATRASSGRLTLGGNLESGLNRLELRCAESSLVRETGKPILDSRDGLEREWRVRAVGSLRQGRYAALERADGVTIVLISQRADVSIGKAYAVKRSAKGLKIARSVELER